MKQSENQTSNKSHAYVIIADEDVSAYIEQKGIKDINAYMTRLLQEEMERQRGKRSKVGKPAH